jgi:hypothetical protein
VYRKTSQERRKGYGQKERKKGRKRRNEEINSISVVVETLHLSREVRSSGCGQISSDKSQTKVSTNEEHQIVGNETESRFERNTTKG